jgi:hypothetical protein
MSCNLAQGITFGCRDNAGGVNKVWITDFDNITSITKNSGDTITAISGTGTFYSFDLIRTTSEMTETKMVLFSIHKNWLCSLRNLNNTREIF